MAEVHDRERPTFEKENNVTIQRCFFAYEYARPFIEGKDIADVGCGNGYGSEYMAGYAKSVIGLDYSEATVADNSQRLKHLTNLSFKSCKVPPLALDDCSVDVVTAFQFIEHIHPRREFMQDVLRVLKPGGVFICTTPNSKKSIARNPFHVFEYTFNEMQQEAGNVFQQIELQGLDGNDKVNTYYAKNQAWAKKILRLDPLGIHKLIPSSWIVGIYNRLTSNMRKKLAEDQPEALTFTTADFHLKRSELDTCWDIFLVAKKQG